MLISNIQEFNIIHKEKPFYNFEKLPLQMKLLKKIKNKKFILGSIEMLFVWFERISWLKKGKYVFIQKRQNKDLQRGSPIWKSSYVMFILMSW